MNSVLILFTLLSVNALEPNAPGQKEALRAYYKYTGLETHLTNFEREHVPKELRENIGTAALITQTVINRRLTVKISFP